MMLQESVQDKPVFSDELLLDFAGSHRLLRAAKGLLDAQAVRSWQWQWPVLSGEVTEQGTVYRPELNLRSLTFAQNQCSCSSGAGKMCVHALAVCLASDEQALTDAPDSSAAPDDTVPVLPVGDIQSLQLSQRRGIPLSLRVYLPPPMKLVAPRHTLVIRFAAQVQDEEVPLEQLDRGRAYALQDSDKRLLAYLEQLCSGRLLSIVQLQLPQLEIVLHCMRELPVVFWANKPNQPIPWDGPGELLAVHDKIRQLKEQIVVEAQHKHNQRQQERQQMRLQRQRVAAATANVGPPRIDGSSKYLAITLPGRSHQSYHEIVDILKDNGFQLEPSNRKWWLRDRHKVLNFLARYWEEVSTHWQAEYTDNFAKHWRYLQTVEIVSEGESSGQDSYTIRIKLQAGDIGVDEIYDALSKNQHYLFAGEHIYLLQPQQIMALTEVQRQLSGNPEQTLVPQFERRMSTAALIDVEGCLEGLGVNFQAPEAWLECSAALKSVDKLTPAPVAPALDQRLRSYQRIGVAWLWHLYQNKLAGVLADEMGLGKTVQALALLASIIDKQPSLATPCLVVCPAALVENWRREAAKFVPMCRVFVHYRYQRAHRPQDIQDYDIIITSYSTLARDIALFADLDFACVVADEAQHVKNRQTKNARALKQLRSQGRFLLTGTPLENSLQELRSLFEFLLPGYLQPVPKMAKASERAWYDDRLRQQCAPYILRRSKAMVTPELPPKIEQTIYCDMDPMQAKCYQDILADTRRHIFELQMAGKSDNVVSIAVLNQLLRLRQVCVDPRLIDQQMQAASSAKLRVFREVLQEALDDGHRLLVFSQFVTMLQLLKEELEQQNTPYYYLDGKTKDRAALCERFNNDPAVPVFLISLKAGGQGLNLTGADTVIHMDPWWNPAVEAQATDRAHRIGQTRVVSSIKLIVAGTVEERVLALQSTKAKLLKDLFVSSEETTAKVRLQDIRQLLE